MSQGSESKFVFYSKNTNNSVERGKKDSVRKTLCDDTYFLLDALPLTHPPSVVLTQSSLYVVDLVN